MSEAKNIKNRLVSSTTNAVCTYTIDDALAAFNMMDFCLVILDASMSASDDHNILKAMRASKTMPILVLSSHADHTERIHAFNAGAHAYMGKPYTDEECLAQAHTFTIAMHKTVLRRAKWIVLFLCSAIYQEPYTKLIKQSIR